MHSFFGHQADDQRCLVHAVRGGQVAVQRPDHPPSARTADLKVAGTGKPPKRPISMFDPLIYQALKD